MDVLQYEHVHLFFFKWMFHEVQGFKDIMMNVDNIEPNFTLLHYWKTSTLCDYICDVQSWIGTEINTYTLTSEI